MKILLTVLLLGSLTLSAALDATEFMKVVAASPAVREITEEAKNYGYAELIKLERTKTFRCMGCYEYTLTFRDEDNKTYTYTVQTSMEDPRSSKITVARK